jgi:hypothetical protein
MHLRTHQWLASALAVALCGTAVAARGQDSFAPAAPPSDRSMFASESVTPAGRIQVDTAAFTQNGNYLKTTEANGVEFRRLYLGLKGSGFDVLEYKV